MRLLPRMRRLSFRLPSFPTGHVAAAAAAVGGAAGAGTVARKVFACASLAEPGLWAGSQRHAHRALAGGVGPFFAEGSDSAQ
jgi:hypothetical protein